MAVNFCYKNTQNILYTKREKKSSFLSPTPKRFDKLRDRVYNLGGEKENDAKN